MNAYVFIFVWLGLLVILANSVDVTVLENVHGRNVRRWGILLSVVAFFPIFLLASTGTPVGDTWLYISKFRNTPISYPDVISELNNIESGQAFFLFGVLVKKIFGENVIVYRLLIATIHSLPVILIYKKYSNNYLMSLFLFVASGCHISWMMNGIRQFIAVALIFAVTPFLCEKKYGVVVTVILIASSFHISALIMLPVIFIVQGKSWNSKTIFYIIVALILMYIFDKYTGSFDALLVGTEYEGAVANLQEQGDDGTNPIRVLVNAVPMLLAFVGRKQIRQENNVMLNICVNMSVITTGIYLISMVTSGIMIGRLPIYTGLYSFILLPNLVPTIFTNKSTKIVNVLMIVFYMIYYAYETIL